MCSKKLLPSLSKIRSSPFRGGSDKMAPDNRQSTPMREREREKIKLASFSACRIFSSSTCSDCDSRTKSFCTATLQKNEQNIANNFITDIKKEHEGIIINNMLKLSISLKKRLILRKRMDPDPKKTKKKHHHGKSER